MTLLEQIRYRAKAILNALGAALVGLVVWLVTNPDTATALGRIIPEPWVVFVPIVLAWAASVFAVNRVPNRTPTLLTRSTDDDELIEEPSVDTTHVSAITTGDDGFETGGGR
jgi:hypothetical protein